LVSTARIDDDVGAQFQWFLQHRSEESIVHRQPGAGFVGGLRRFCDVGQLQGGVGGGFYEHQPGFVGKGGDQRPLPGGVCESGPDAEALQHLAQHPHGPAIDYVRDHYVIAGLEQGEEQRGQGGHPRREAGGG
jgi:hypothetical protein